MSQHEYTTRLPPTPSTSPTQRHHAPPYVEIEKITKHSTLSHDAPYDALRTSQASDAPVPISGYDHIRRLGNGSSAQVHLYRRRADSQHVAIKILHNASSAHTNQRLLARKELSILRTLGAHPHIVSVHDAGFTQSTSYLITDYAPYGSCQDMLNRKPYDVATTLDYGIRLAGAVTSSHAHGIIHCDIKPSNILIDANARPLLADFGIAHALYNPYRPAYSIAWAAPEVLHGSPPHELADVYSLAACLYAMICGTSPFRTSRTSTPTGNTCTRPPTPPSLPQPHAPPALDRLIRKALNNDPTQRPPCALTFATELQHIQQQLYGYATPLIV